MSQGLISASMSMKGGKHITKLSLCQEYQDKDLELHNAIWKLLVQSCAWISSQSILQSYKSVTTLVRVQPKHRNKRQSSTRMHIHLIALTTKTSSDDQAMFRPCGFRLLLATAAPVMAPDSIDLFLLLFV